MHRNRSIFLAIGATLALNSSSPAGPAESLAFAPVPPSEVGKVPTLLMAELAWGQTSACAADPIRLTLALVSNHPALYHRFIGLPRFDWRGAVLTSHDPFVGVFAGLPRHYIPLITARGVRRAGPIDRLRNGLLGLDQ